MKKRILIVEDEEKIARVLELELTYEGYEVKKAFDGLDGLSLFREEKWDLVLLDIMLPGLSGIEVLRRIRAGDTQTPIIMLTAKDSIEDKVTGLDFGANDYMTKPFQIEELLARVRVALRSTTQVVEEEPSSLLTLEDLQVNIDSREVIRDGQSIDLTPREFDLLVCLLENVNIVLNREQLLDHVWGYDYYGDTNVVDVYIRYLRNKVDKPFKSTALIQTVRGVGYVMRESK